MSTTVSSFDLFQTVTDRIIDLLEHRIIPWRKPWAAAGPPMNVISKRPYQGINLWLLHSLSYDSNLFLTWDQLKQAGGSVIKGQTGHVIVYWKRPEQPEEDLTDAQEQTAARPILRYHKVFNVLQCTNLPAKLLEADQELQVDPIAACEGIIEKIPNGPAIRFERNKAFYDPVRDYINMPRMKRFKSIEAYYRTLFHEEIHATGHRDRLNRPTITEMAEFGSEPYSIEELIAELGSCYLAATAGILEPEIKNSAAYIKGWLSVLKKDKRIMLHISSYAQKAVDYILNRLEVLAPT